MSAGLGNAVVRVAIPTASSIGMAATASDHFGHCACFTVVDVVEGKPGKTLIVDNPPHNDCLGPVGLLQSQGVNTIIVQGIGMRPLAGFNNAGIDVFVGSGKTVGDLVSSFAAGELKLIDERNACGGSAGCTESKH